MIELVLGREIGKTFDSYFIVANLVHFSALHSDKIASKC